MINYLALWLLCSSSEFQTATDTVGFLACLIFSREVTIDAFIRSRGLGEPLPMLRQVILSLTFEPYPEMIGHGAAVGECMGSKCANVALQVYAHVALTLRTILHVDGETTLWITTSHPYCCQLNQRYTTLWNSHTTAMSSYYLSRQEQT